MSKSYIREIVAASGAYFQVDSAAMRGRIRRHSPALRARSVAIHIVRNRNMASLPALGHHFAIDHTTVLYHQRRMWALLEEQDPDLAQEVAAVQEIAEHLKSRRLYPSGAAQLGAINAMEG